MNYSQKARKALAYLFKPYNDIDIYVEDTNSYRVYAVLFKRMLPKDISLRKIFQLPGREAVVNECTNYLNKDVRKTLFIIDGDFNILLPIEDFSSYTNLYQLKVFCMENLLVSKDSLIEVAADCLSNAKLEEIELIINYNTFIYNIANRLTPLILIYHLCHLLNYDTESVVCNVSYFFKEEEKVISLDETKIQNRMNEIKNKLLERYSINKVQDEMNNISDMLPTKPKDIIKLICGKRYSIPLVFHHLHRKVNYNSDFDTLKARLARHCDLKIDPGLQNALIRASTR